MKRSLLSFSSFAPVCIALLASCATVPEGPIREALPQVAGEFSGSEAVEFSMDEVSSDWWTGFQDPVLTRLIETALTQNADLSVAEANVAVAQAFVRTRTLGTTVSTTATGGVEIGRAPREGADIELTGNAQLLASWEYDAFDRIASQVRSAEFDVIALNEARRDLATIIAAETALAYADLRGNQVRLRVAETNAGLQLDSLDLLNTLFANGRATRLDVERAESQYRTTLATLPQLEANVRIAASRLAALTGKTGLSDAPEVAALLEAIGATPIAPARLSIGTPEQLIQRRPDIRTVEAEIASLLALGEAERARLFPTLTFSANLLSLFAQDNDLVESFGFGIGPAIRWDGPDLRRVRADIDLTDARTRLAFARYEATVVTALNEVEIALTGYSQELARQDDLEAAATAAERAVELARLRFEEGVDDFLDVIDAQRTLLDAQDRLELSRLDTTRQAIAAYRALGGIWSDEALSSARPSGENNVSQ